MRLGAGGSVTLLAPERGEDWAADLGVIAAEGQKPSAAVYLSKYECTFLGRWLLDMAGEPSRQPCLMCCGLGSIPGFWLGTSKTCTSCHGRGYR